MTLTASSYHIKFHNFGVIELAMALVIILRQPPKHIDGWTEEAFRPVAMILFAAPMRVSFRGLA